jgi:cytochrome c oxidase cbb3-type subunit 3
MSKNHIMSRVPALLGAIILLHSVARADGTETALIATGTFTAAVAILLFFVIFVLEGNIDAIVTFLRTSWAYVMAKPGEKVAVLDEEFDGIVELDNRIPPWFNYLFGATVVFAAFYLLDYHVLGGSPLSGQEYQQEVASADVARRVLLASQGDINEDALTPLKDYVSLKSGRDKFNRNCVSCHGALGQGIVGPNLTDAYWIHGGGIKNVYATIKNGVPAKGMISWKLVFMPKEIQEIASYVLTLQGSNPPGGKAPEGTVWVEPKPAPADSTATQKM